MHNILFFNEYKIDIVGKSLWYRRIKTPHSMLLLGNNQLRGWEGGGGGAIRVTPYVK